MPALINLCANFSFGAVMGAVPEQPGPEGHGVSWSLLLLLLFEAVIAIPVSTYLLRFYPHWSLSYAYDPQVTAIDSHVGLLSLASLVANAGAALGGFAISQQATRQGRLRRRWAPVAGGAAVAVVVVALSWRRVWFVGTHDAFLHGNGRPLALVTPGLIGLSAYAIAAGVAVWTHRRRGNRPPVF